MASRAAAGVRIARGILVAAGVAGAASAAAQSRSHYTLNVLTEVEHDSNPNMTVGDSPGVTWLRAVPSLTLGYVLGNNEFGLDAALTAERSSDPDVAQNRLDPRLRGVWKHADVFNTLEVFALAERRALRALDVRNHVPIGVDGARTLYSVGGIWTREFDERSRLLVDLRQNWERFTDVNTPDFQLTVGAARYTRQHDERRSWHLAVNGQHYRSESVAGSVAVPATTNTVAGVVLGVSQSFSEAFRVDAAAGPMHFSDSSQDGWQGLLSGTYTGERWSGGIDLARTPGVNSTAGGLVVTDEARLRLRYDLGPVTRLEVGAAYSLQSDPDSRNAYASAALVHQWTAAWQVAVRASSNRQQGFEGTARSNRIALVLTYSATDL